MFASCHTVSFHLAYALAVLCWHSIWSSIEPGDFLTLFLSYMRRVSFPFQATVWKPSFLFVCLFCLLPVLKWIKEKIENRRGQRICAASKILLNVQYPELGNTLHSHGGGVTLSTSIKGILEHPCSRCISGTFLFIRESPHWLLSPLKLLHPRNHSIPPLLKEEDD